MKKIVSFILALTLIMSMHLSAFAALSGAGDHDIDVIARFQDNSTVDSVRSVDISWGAMQFTYTKEGKIVWNAEDHTYTDNTSAVWTGKGNQITVTNHSNVEVTASFTFTPISTDSTVTGSFDIVSEKMDAGVENGYETADQVTTTLTLGGSLADSVTDFTKVGTITVNIA